MAKTFNKRPATFDTVDSDDLDYAYQNMSSPSGINESKNFVNVDQNSFAEAENVYIDEDNLLSSRPGLKEKEQTTMEAAVISADTTIVDVFNVNGILFYHLKSSDNTYSVWSELTGEHSCDESLKITYMGNRYVFFTTNDIFAWNVNKDEWESKETVIYLTITVTGAETNESENIFGTGGIIQDIITDISTVVWSKYNDETITLTIDDNEYTITFVEGQEDLFVKLVSNVTLSNVQANGSAIIGESGSVIYYSYAVTNGAKLFTALPHTYTYSFIGNAVLSRTTDNFVHMLVGDLSALYIAYYQIGGTTTDWTYTQINTPDLLSGSSLLNENFVYNRDTSKFTDVGSSDRFDQLVSGQVKTAINADDASIDTVGASGLAQSKSYAVFLFPISGAVISHDLYYKCPMNAEAIAKYPPLNDTYCEQQLSVCSVESVYGSSFSSLNGSSLQYLLDTADYTNVYLFVFVNLEDGYSASVYTPSYSFCNIDDIIDQRKNMTSMQGKTYQNYLQFIYCPKLYDMTIDEDTGVANILYVTYLYRWTSELVSTTLNWQQVLLHFKANDITQLGIVTAERPVELTPGTTAKSYYKHDVKFCLTDTDISTDQIFYMRVYSQSKTLTWLKFLQFLCCHPESSAGSNAQSVSETYPKKATLGINGDVISSDVYANTDRYGTCLLRYVSDNGSYSKEDSFVDDYLAMYTIDDSGDEQDSGYKFYIRHNWYSNGFIVDDTYVPGADPVFSSKITAADHFARIIFLDTFLVQNTIDVCTSDEQFTSNIASYTRADAMAYCMQLHRYLMDTDEYMSTITSNVNVADSVTAIASAQGTTAMSLNAAFPAYNYFYVKHYEMAATTSTEQITTYPVYALLSKPSTVGSWQFNGFYNVKRNYAYNITMTTLLSDYNRVALGTHTNILLDIAENQVIRILTNYYYYSMNTWKSTIVSNLIPISLNYDNAGAILFQTSTKDGFYAVDADADSPIIITKYTDVTYNILIPDHSLQFTNDFLSFGNELYYRTKTEDDQIYFAKDSQVLFPSNITNMIQLSETSVAIFLATEVYIMTYQGIDETTGVVNYTCTKSKLQLGCREGDDVMLIYDGSTILLPTLKGLTSLTYDKLVLNTEQVYSYLSDNLSDLYKELIDGNILLQQYKQYIVVYSPAKNYCYIYDLNNSSWWKWRCSKKIDKILYANESLLIFMDNKLYTFNDETDPYYDFANEDIEWHFKSQKLHFSAPNNYKHVYNMIIETSSDDSKDVRYKLALTNYRKSKNEEDGQIFEYSIDGVSHFVKRCNYYKTAAFQYKLSSVYNEEPKQFKLSNIAIKYRITDGIR